MSAPEPSTPVETPPVLRPSTQPFSRKTVIIACAVIGVPLLAIMIGRLSEQHGKTPPEPVNETSAPAEYTSAPTMETPSTAPATLEPQSDTLPAPNPTAPETIRHSHVAVLVLNATMAGIGFADQAGNVAGALTCDMNDRAKPTSLWFRVGRFSPWRLKAYEGYWTINDRRISQRLELRVDGRTFPVENPQILVFEHNMFKVSGALAISPALQAALRAANFVELVSGDAVLSVAPGAFRSDVIAVADKCARIGATGNAPGKM